MAGDSGPTQDGSHCPHQDAEIEPERLTVHVFQVVFYSLGPSERIPPSYLRQAGEPRADQEPPALALVVSLYLVT